MTDSYEKLKADFPLLYENVSCGMDHPVGWHALIRDLSEKLSPGVRCTQTKPKFGGLRFYCIRETLTDEDCKHINYAEAMSWKTCMGCGTTIAPVTPRGYCQECRDKPNAV